MRRGNLTQIGAPLDKAFRRADLDGRLREARCLDLWPEVVGEANAHATRADSIRDGILFVSVKSSAWAQELGFLKLEIIRKLNERLGKKIIKDIQFKTRTLKKPAPKSEKPAEPGIESVTLSAEELEAARNSVSHLPEEPLREKMLQVMISQRKMEKLKSGLGWIPCKRCRSLHPGVDELCPICKMQLKIG